jgi:hypothetical protein
MSLIQVVMEELKKIFWCIALTTVLCGLINNCTKRPTEQRARSPYSPLRQPMANGICDCPYDYAQDDRQCGRMSAWWHPNGREPECYFGDIYGYPPS